MLETQPLALSVTPLSPVHIGCGVDFDPTAYVIRDGVLYTFDAADLPLTPSDRSALLRCVEQPGENGILAVQRFFAERADLCLDHARHAIAVAPGVEQQYLARVGRVAQREGGGRDVINHLTFERTAHHPHSGIPYLPGSSLKGAMRTAWLNHLNRGRSRLPDEKSAQVEERLLGGKFHTDPFRLVRVSDAMGDAVLSEIAFCTNHSKRPKNGPGSAEREARGPETRREYIIPGQWAIMHCGAQISQLLGHNDPRRTPSPENRISGWQQLARACNAFYLRQLHKDLQLLQQRQLATPQWIGDLQSLMKTLQPALESGAVVLLRVGRHSGAESVTVEGMREIRIMQGPGRWEWKRESTTVWLAARHVNVRSDMLPFGWVLLHPADMPLPALQRWCEQQAKPDLTAARKRMAEAAAAAKQRAADMERQRREQAEAEQRRREEEERQRRELEALSPHGKEVRAFRDQLLAHTASRKQPISGVLYQRLRQLLQRAEQESWNPQDRAALADLLQTLVPKKIDLGSKAKEIRQAAQRLNQQP